MKYAFNIFYSSIDDNRPMAKISSFFMCFDIFFDLNEFLEEVEKLFVGAGEGVTRPYK